MSTTAGPPSAEDHERFTRRWTQAQPIVAAFLATAVPDLHEAEDLLQNVAMILLRKHSEYDTTQSFVGWALGIARFEVLARRRDHARNRVMLSSEVIERAAAVYEELVPELDERRLALRLCLKRLRGRAPEALRLRYDDGLALEAIATRLGMPTARCASSSAARGWRCRRASNDVWAPGCDHERSSTSDRRLSRWCHGRR